MTQNTVSLLQLAPEIRNKIWALAFRDLEVVPFEGVAEARDDPGQAMCITCQEDGRSTRSIGYVHAFRSLLTCKQLYAEASPILLNTLSLKISACHSLGRVKTELANLRKHLRHLCIYCHMNEGTRETWMSNLTGLYEVLPALETLTIHAHLRPPTEYENLVDAIFLCGPLVHYPTRIKQDLHFQYVEDRVMFFRPEFGTIYYHDALDEHEKVIRDLLQDQAFKNLAKCQELDLMTARLLQIAREHEQPWIESLRAKRVRELEAEKIASEQRNEAASGSDRPI